MKTATARQMDVHLIRQTESDVDRVREAARHLILSGGKRLRPRFTLLIAAAVGLDEKTALCVGTAAELVHAATLLHDDVIDRSEMRRGQPTVNAKYGAGSAILTGDFLLAGALAQLTEDKLFTATAALATTVRRLAEAEILQLQQAFRADTTMAQTRQIAEGKTGALFAWCGEAAAASANASSEIVSTATRLGLMLGYAFQIADDLLDFLPFSRSGKPGMKDLREGQITVPVQLARAQDARLDESVRRAMDTKLDADFDLAYERIRGSRAAELGRAEMSVTIVQMGELLATLTQDSELQAEFEKFVTECTVRAS